MSESLNHHAHRWVGAAGVSVADLFARLIAALDDWRERQQLRDELDELERTGQLDGVLGEVGVLRGQIPVLLAGRPGAGRRMDQMLQHRAIDRAALQATYELREAEWRCLQCRNTHECERWLTSDHSANEAPSFCPNSPTFDLVRAQRSRADDRAHVFEGGDWRARQEQGGILAELEAMRGQTR